MKKYSLCGDWNGTGISPDGNRMQFKGTVPGCVHTDLLKEKKITDPFYRYNSKDCQWIEKWNWYYERIFEVNELSDDAYFYFEGLDTYCDIYLNGKHIASTDDMFIDYKIPAKYRDVVMLRIYADMPFSQVAAALDISESSAKVIYFRAKKMLMEELKDEFAM
jgi:beta-galactosidase/beta-glucuronidase